MKLLYEYYMNIGLFGTYFNLILDKMRFFGNIVSLSPWGRGYKVFKQMSLIFMSLFRKGR